MFRHILCSATLAALAVLGGAARAEGGRHVVTLDGTWQIAEGSMAATPKAFDRKAPVPGLADMAVPAFEGVGYADWQKRDPRREAVLADRRREAFWYRRTFTLDGPLPAFATLKIRQACYGTRVYLNGRMVGDNAACFTPACFDVRNALKGGGAANEILIRVGASPAAVPKGYPWGHDFEKTRYIPGICDSVELTLSGSPHVERVQAAPDVAGKKVRVVAVVRASDAAAEATVTCTVREVATHKLVGTARSQPLRWNAGQAQTVELTAPIENCRLWSPEDPFLYEVETSTGSDTSTDRFGMRSFSFDAKTKRAMLNGRPYYLRGTNICIYRFFGDPLRGDKPWREDWVRQVIRAFRGMHWNSARYCIGFPPEMWYRIADEEGFMIQDEFPIWEFSNKLDVDGDVLVGQFTQWMQARWNHPSVVIWDAQNETVDKEGITGKAIKAVRKLDLSHRPWDNGFGPPQEPTDEFEAHPYRSGEPWFRMSAFAHMPAKPGEPGSGSGNALPNSGDNPIVIDEYGWLWVNRDGTPTTLSRDVYARLLPERPTAEQYRDLYARLLAAKTEFWRCGRKVAGVLHFCGLGYSRPGGQTSDNFIDLERPTFEPHFLRYVRDAFAPLGLMIDFWDERCRPGAALKLPVVVINDLYTGWKGPLTLRLLHDGKPMAVKTRTAEVAALARAVFPFELRAPVEPGKYQFVAELSDANGRPVRSLRDFRVASPGIAVGCRATASSTYGGNSAQLAVDGDPNTHWSSLFSDPQWLAVDLGKVTKIAGVELEWDPAYAKTYAIQVSPDGKSWTDVYKTTAGRGNTETIRFAPVDARWVRYYGTQRATQWGHCLWEFRVFPAASSGSLSGKRD